ncbi:MAG TPA: hypothetical protein PK586_05295 [Casimicrobium sp.]|nr:hypothetical protein [Casimicrobium sp.]
MSTPGKLLPTELAALVHHVELNRAGWWDKAIHRLVLAAVWLSDKPPTISGIQGILRDEFRLSLNDAKVSAATQALESQNLLVRLDGPAFRIPDDKRATFEGEIADAENATAKAKAYFGTLVAELCPELQPDDTWQTFESAFLAPLIKEVGANAYHLIAGQRMTADKKLVQRFLGRFEAKFHPALNVLVSRFLEPKNGDVRTYVSRLLHATFCVEASGLPENVIQKLNASGGKPISFRVFVDTNFLFSILALHENPSNAAASELQELIATLKGNPKIALFVTPRTIEEAKQSISLAKGQLAGVPMGTNFTNAALRVGFSGMAEKFLEERRRRGGNLTVDDWFDPYLNNFVSVARGKNVELYNEKLDEYATRQDVIDDIHLLIEAEKRRNSRRKSYEMIEHDMILWHLVDDNRPAYIESPIDAKDWILTVDYRFIGFDEHKQKKASAKVPTCLHPTSLIQLLQFWVPRTAEFEEAILGSLRLPFLFQEFDADAERTSLRILKGIGRFENSENLSEEAINDVVLNEGLRARIKTEKNEDAETTLIRDALVEGMTLRAEDEANKAKALEEEVRKRDSDIATLADQKRAVEEENAQTKRAKEEADEAARQALATQGEELGDVKTRLQAMEQAEVRRVEKERDDNATREKKSAQFVYLGSLIVVITLSSIGAWQAKKLFPWYAKILGSLPTSGLIAIITFVLGHLALELSICRRPAISKLWPFLQVKRFSRILWAIVILGFFVGVVGNIFANWIQKNLDAETNSPPAADAKVPEPPVSK